MKMLMAPERVIKADDGVTTRTRYHRRNYPLLRRRNFISMCFSVSFCNRPARCECILYLKRTSRPHVSSHRHFSFVRIVYTHSHRSHMPRTLLAKRFNWRQAFGPMCFVTFLSSFLFFFFLLFALFCELTGFVHRL